MIAAATTRVLIAAHSHPLLSSGGGEISAYRLFDALGQHPGFESWFLGCVGDQLGQKLGATISQPFSSREYLYTNGNFDWFKFANRDPTFAVEFRKLLGTLVPQIVHFHHYINFGVEAFLQVRRVLPDCKIVLTLHEYLAICHHFGQMIRTDRHSLCYEASPVRCHSCFKDISPSDFFLRDLYIKRFFDLVDHFISPSDFLAERYVAWGVPENRISVIENVVAVSAPEIGVKPARSDGPLRVGFFGQISILKGINVALDAAKILEQSAEHGIVIEIFGDHRHQPQDFQEAFLKRLQSVGHNVKFHGPYDQNRVDQSMRSVDLILIPSIWWENSPVVIQEALRNRRPIICSDIGGMAEKVQDGRDGFHFPVGNPVALAALLRRLAADRSLIETAAASLQPASDSTAIFQKHETLYRTLVGAVE